MVTDSPITPIVDKFEAIFRVVDNLDDKFLVSTNLDAPNNKLILIDTKNHTKESWKTILPETKNVMQSVSLLSGKLIVTYLKDANSKVSVYTIAGKYLYDVKLPGVGTVSGFGGKKDESETFYTFTSFAYPPTIFKYDVKNNKSELFRKAEVKFDPSGYETKEVFYKSKDSTKYQCSSFIKKV